MKITPTTTVEELMLAGCTLTTPLGFEMRGNVDKADISMRVPTPAGVTAAGHYPLNPFGVHLACGDAASYEEVCASDPECGQVAMRS